MSDKNDISLRDGTMVRHKSKGYQGKIDGTTSIKTCFTRDGTALQAAATKETFQYRISVHGEALRQVAPLEDLEILDAAVEINCGACHRRFYTKPGFLGKPCGRCACGGWICPVCMSCQAKDAAQTQATDCVHQRKRILRKAANEKKTSARHLR